MVAAGPVADRQRAPNLIPMFSTHQVHRPRASLKLYQAIFVVQELSL